jgi:glycosyltransferase involved in cell wall biosynthesis
MSRIRVLHTLCRIHSGGVEQRRILLAQGLSSDFYEHALICQEESGPVAGYLRDAGWKIHEIGLAPGILNRNWHARAHKIAQAFKPNIVHGAVYEGEALACGIGMRMPRVKVIMEETSDPVDRRWTGNALMRAMCLRADACVGVSPKVTEYLRETLWIPERKIRLINNAVREMPAPTTTRLAELRSTLGIDDNDVIIGSVGRVFDDHKRFSDIILALPKIRSVQPKARLLIVGDGPDRNKLERLSNELGGKDAVVFAGYQGAPRDFYHLMDVFVLASAHEAFGLVLVEAMLAEVPIVATEVGGIPFVLDNGRAGVLVQPKQPEELASAILHLLTDQKSAQTFRKSGLERALAAFSAERYVSDVESLYAELLQ